MPNFAIDGPSTESISEFAGSLLAIPVTSDRSARALALRVDYWPGYRVYFVQRGKIIVILLCGGDKRTQDRDIATAKSIAKELGDEGHGN